MAKIRMNEVNGVALLLFAVCASTGIAISQPTRQPAFAVIGSLWWALYFLFAIKVVRQWEKVAVLRLGRYVGLRGPGLCHIVPIVETLSPYVDQRVRVASVSAESTLTRDTVPVNVDAIVFWMVWNAEKSILEVENFVEAITLSAQTALRESIGRHELAQMITERETLGRELQRILDEKTNPWGITVQSVEIRDVKIPQGLEDAMSRQAQAERERQARIILGQAETKSPKASCKRHRLHRKPSRPASARHEHAVRSHQGKGCDGDRALVRSRNHGPRWHAGHRVPRRSKTITPENLATTGWPCRDVRAPQPRRECMPLRPANSSKNPTVCWASLKKEYCYEFNRMIRQKESRLIFACRQPWPPCSPSPASSTGRSNAKRHQCRLGTTNNAQPMPDADQDRLDRSVTSEGKLFSESTPSPPLHWWMK